MTVPPWYREGMGGTTRRRGDDIAELIYGEPRRAVSGTAGKREEGRGKREEGRGKREEGNGERRTENGAGAEPNLLLTPSPLVGEGAGG
jgi:hypothetical protein